MRRPLRLNNDHLGKGMSGNPIATLYYGRHRRAFRFGTYLALLRIMAVGRLVVPVYGHTRLATETLARLSQTRQTIRDLIVQGLETPEGRATMERLRAVHRNIKAPIDDYQYILCLFVTEPIRWNASYCRHPLTPEELDRLCGFWTKVGRGMDVPMPPILEGWHAFQRDFERANFRFTSEGHALASQCLDAVVRISLPRGTQTVSRHLLLATMDPMVREVLKLEPDRPVLHRLLRTALKKL